MDYLTAVKIYSCHFLELADSLDELETSQNHNRDTENNLMYTDEQASDPTKNQKAFDDDGENFEVKSVLKNVQVPMKEGSPAFSIHADKVYILYPSLFQDPNIFGRFSIPQNINLDPLPEKKVPNDNEAVKNLSTSQPFIKAHSPALQLNDGHNSFPGYNQPNNRKMRRQAPDPAPSNHKLSTKKEDNKKRNVESHLTGTIVVLNQDVNEYNRKESY